MRTLRKGDRGNEVKELQAALNGAANSLEKLDVDGIFGAKTFNAVVHFQLESGLRADGVVGAETWKALKRPTNQQLYNAFITCLDAIEELPEFKQLRDLLGV